MACLLVPAAGAVVTTVAAKMIKSTEKDAVALQVSTEHGIETVEKIPFSKKLNWFSKLLWGGSALLLFEHVWHGEVVPWFPFLTSASNPADTAVMLEEMASVGGSMLLLITLVWGGMLIVAGNIQKKALQPQVSEK